MPGRPVSSRGPSRGAADHQNRGHSPPAEAPSERPRTWRYRWDASDRLVGVTTPDGARWRYRYDPLGRRIAKERLGDDDTILEAVGFVWDGAVLAEQTRSGEGDGSDRTTVWEWEPGGFRPLSQAERAPLRDAPQDFIDERFFAIITDLVGAAKRTGVDATDARTLRDWANEVGLPSRGPETHPGRPFGRHPHIHIGPVDHIRVI